MKSRILHVRLRPQEDKALSRICDSPNGAKKNASAMVRMLIIREDQRRRTRSSVVPNEAYDTEHRTGRPKKEK